jgi:hypothetical protein
MKVKVYEAKIAEMTIDNEKIRDAQTLHAFRPIPRGNVRIAGEDRLCLGSSQPIGEVEVGDDAVIETREDTFGPDYEVYRWAGQSLSAYQARCLILGR